MYLPVSPVRGEVAARARTVRWFLICFLLGARVKRTNAGSRRRGRVRASAALVVLLGSLTLGQPVWAEETPAPAPTAPATSAPAPSEPAPEPPASEAPAPTAPTAPPASSGPPAPSTTPAASADPTSAAPGAAGPSASATPDPTASGAPEASETASPSPTASATPGTTPRGAAAPGPVPSPIIVSPTTAPDPSPSPNPSNPWPMVTVVDETGRAIPGAVIDFTVCTKVPGKDGQQCVTASTVLDEGQRTIQGISDLIARSTLLPDADYTTITVEVSIMCVLEGYEVPTRSYTATLTPNGTAGGWKENDQGPADGVLTFVAKGNGTDPQPPTPPPVTPPPVSPPPVTTPPVTVPPTAPVPPTNGPTTAPATTPVAAVPLEEAVPQQTAPTTPEAGPSSRPAPAASATPEPTTASTPPTIEPAPQDDPGSLTGLANSPIAPILGGGVIIAGLLLAFAPPMQRPPLR